MKARPILFSGEMVRALLEGRKTQTRRIVKFPIRDRHIGCELAGNEIGQQEANELCPYGQPGDLLWVRETHFINDFREAHIPIDERNDCEILYLATDENYVKNLEDDEGLRWRPSIHMPRWASRLTLRIQDVRVERLHDIDQECAIAEGIIDGGCLNCGNSSHPLPCGCDTPQPDFRDSFAYLWQKINGQDSWHENPWVWVVEFEVIKENIQEVTRES